MMRETMADEPDHPDDPDKNTSDKARLEKLRQTLDSIPEQHPLIRFQVSENGKLEIAPPSELKTSTKTGKLAETPSYL